MALRDDLIRHQVFLQRLVKTENKVVAPQLNAIQRGVAVAIYQGANVKKIRRVVQTKLADIGRTVEERMLAIAEYEAHFTGKILDKYTTYQIKEAKKEVIKQKLKEAKMNIAIQKPPLTIKKSFEQFAVNKAIDVQRTLFGLDIDYNGETVTPKELQKNKVSAVGLLFTGLISYQLLSLIDTSVNKSANIGRASTYDANMTITPQVTWRTELDDAVCPYCEDLEGTEMDSDQFDGEYPAHANCRCFAEPIIQDDTE